MKITITDAEYPNIDEIERPILEAAGFDVVLAQCRSPEEVIESAQDAVGLIVQYAPIDRTVLTALPDVHIVSRYGVGMDTIDLQAARDLGVWVANVPDYGVQEVATHSCAMLLSLVRHLAFYDRDVRHGVWSYQRPGPLHRPSSMTLGVIGVGRIGRTVANYARAFFGKVIGHDPWLSESTWPEGVEPSSLDDLLRRSNAVSLHLPLTPETQELVDKEFLTQMPKGSYLVNASRGGLIRMEDLLRALDSGQLAGAALDVLPQEPPSPDHPILKHPRVVLSPHAAWYSMEAEIELRRKAALNIVRWAQEGAPPYVIVQGCAWKPDI